VLSPAGVERALHETPLPAPEGDVSVAELIGSRLGTEVVERLVEPLLGGVYAGHASLLSARATIPQVVGLLNRAATLTDAVAALPASDGGPVFAGLVGGMGTLPVALAASGRFEVQTDAMVRELNRVATEQGDRWQVVVGSTRDARTIDADHVVLATPAAPTARLLADLASEASAELAAIETASMAVVTFAFRAQDVSSIGTGDSGFLVPPVDGRHIKASTFSFNKWDWVREAGGDLRLLRTSIGRHREEASLQVDDDELVRRSLLDLGAATGLATTPVDAHVQRWGGGLPQYAVGHLDRVARIRASVDKLSAGSTGRIAVCGAAYDGVGIPAVIGSARRAVDELLAGE